MPQPTRRPARPLQVSALAGLARLSSRARATLSRAIAPAAPAVAVRAAIESLEGRRLLVAPAIAPAPFDLDAPTGKSLFVPLDGSDADGDGITYSATVIGNNAANASATVLPQSNRFLAVNVRANGAQPGGTMVFQLFDDIAPDTARRIAGLANSGFYDGLRIPRVVNNFVIQFGSPNADDNDVSDDLQGGPDFTFDDEFDPDVLFTGDGQLAMANSGKDTNGSQVFITEGDTRFLDGRHTIFGQLVSGFALRDAITEVPVATPAGFESPVEPIIIDSVRVVDNEQDGVMRFRATSAGTYTVRVTADDGEETTTRDFTVTVANDTQNSPPVLLPFEDSYVVDQNETLVFTAEAADPEGNAIDYSVQLFGDPDGTVSVDDGTGQVTYVPGPGFTGEAVVRVRVLQASSPSPVFDQQDVVVGVGDSAATGSVRNVDAVAGVPLTNVVVASFTDEDAGGEAGDWAAEIDWGDGTVTPGTIVAGSEPGTFNVVGTHTYDRAAELPLTVVISGDLGAREEVTGLATVRPATSLDTATRILTINGTAAADTITTALDGDELVVTINGEETRVARTGFNVLEIFGRDGNDSIDLSTDSPAARIRGGAGNDTLRAGNDNDELYADAGDDTLDGRGGNDYMEANSGNNYLMGGTGITYDAATLAAGYFDRDTLVGGTGNDTLSGGLDQNFIDATAGGNNLINGSGSRDTLVGGDGNDTIRGFGNSDSLVGNGGDDVLEGDEASGPRGGAATGGNDTLEAGAGNDLLLGVFGNNLFRAGPGADSMFGGAGNDSVEGYDDNEDLIDGIEEVLGSVI